MTDTETRSISGRIWRGTAWTSGANILARIGTFLGNLAIIRLLGLDLTGQLGLIESWVGLITMFAVFGLNLAATKYVSQYLETDRERIGVITGTVLFWGGALAIGVCAAGYLLLLNLPSPGLAPDTIWSTVQITLGGYFWLVLALVMMTSLRQLVAGIVYGLHAFRVFVW
ncbi:MAG: oligosaccharide flippase family protein, partial [Anaerolineales bacterium]|nr:oligosaccharide flippase family protein [Anaerolineales bacterium]